MANSTWALSAAQRADVIARAAASICSLAHARGQHVDDQDAEAAASSLEKRAYAAAGVSANTTTGLRPHDEVITTYARLVLMSR